ncbi:efflux RND transporter permease subunit [Aliidiomarina sp. Khilg15.8]
MFKFFINRPIFSAVISILIVLAGVASIRALPVEQYPEIVPPQVVVNATYPGASADVLSETVAAPLEQAINGVDNMIYMTSNSGDSGMISVSVVFEIGTDPDQATIDVNNRVQSALARLPQAVRTQGVEVNKRSPSILQVVSMYSPDESYDPVYLSNYALLNVIDDLNRIPGVGEASLFGPMDYSMRIWLRPDKLAEYNLMPADVADAIRSQNIQSGAGSIGAMPQGNDQMFTYTLTTQGRLEDTTEFEQIILRSDNTGGTLRLGDVARIELGSQNYATSNSLNGQPAVAMGVYLQPGANAVETATQVRERLDEMSANFPDGVAVDVPFDTTIFVETSIREVVITLLQALVLVVLVVLLFLQKMRATLIPLVAIPVSLIGTFAGMLLLGFSVNLLTLFGLILAIGIVVDNAIIVLENVERLMEEKGIKAKEATIQTMKEVAGAIVASTLVLVAVFLPVAFIEGLSGELYQQFAITIAVSVVLSGVVALTLTPAMCALLLDRQPKEPSAPFRWFNRQFERTTNGYLRVVDFLLKRAAVSMLLFVGVVVLAGFLLARLPGGLVPQEDQGALIGFATLPAASSLNRTEAVRDELVGQVHQLPEVRDVVGVAGFDLIAGGLSTNTAVFFTQLEDWSEREGAGQNAEALAGKVMGIGAGIPEAFVVAFSPPPIQGISITGGFEAYLQSRGDGSIQDLGARAQEIVAKANERPELTNVRSTLDTMIPKYYAEIDREKAYSQDVSVDAILQAMQSTFGSMYVNDFTLFGRNYQVNIQSEADFRREPDDIRKIFVRSRNGEIIPVANLVTLHRTQGPDMVERMNVFPAAKILGDPAPGYSSGQAIDAMQQVVDEMASPNESLQWVGSAYQEQQTGAAATLAFAMGLLIVFLLLAAQYERWSLPLAVASAIPFAVLGASVAVILAGTLNDVYFQIGLLVLIGLAAKNAILIVEFAAQRRAEGMSIVESAREAARLRFRAVMMTALTFILGCMPLVFASGAGAASRTSIGVAVVGGMIAASSLALLFVPVAYQLIEQLSDKMRRKGAQEN